MEARARQESVFLSHCVHRFSFSYLRINGRIGSEVNCVLLQWLLERGWKVDVDPGQQALFRQKLNKCGGSIPLGRHPQGGFPAPDAHPLSFIFKLLILWRFLLNFPQIPLVSQRVSLKYDCFLLYTQMTSGGSPCLTHAMVLEGNSIAALCFTFPSAPFC